METLSPVHTRQKRSLYCITRFVDGFAAGWAMAVPEAFREALDIKYTERVVNKRAYMTWTQGDLFKFEVGDTFYDTHLAYSQWNEVFNSIRLIIQVVAVNDRAIAFKACQPAHAPCQVDNGVELSCDIDAFVALLQTGVLWRHKMVPVNMLESRISDCV